MSCYVNCMILRMYKWYHCLLKLWGPLQAQCLWQSSSSVALLLNRRTDMLIYWEPRCWESFDNILWDSCLSQITVKEGKWPGRVAKGSCQRAICAGGGDWQMCYEGFSLILSRQCRCLSRLPHGNQSGVRSLHFLCPLPPPICRSTWSLNIADFIPSSFHLHHIQLLVFGLVLVRTHFMWY